VPSQDPSLQRYLQNPTNSFPLNGTIAGALAEEHTAGDTTAIQKARHIYDTCSPPGAMTNPAMAGAEVTAVWACTSNGVATAPISIPYHAA